MERSKILFYTSIFATLLTYVACIEDNDKSQFVLAFNTKASMFDNLPHLKALVKHLASMGISYSNNHRQRSFKSTGMITGDDQNKMALLKFHKGVSPEVVTSSKDDFENFLNNLVTDSDNSCSSLTLTAVLRALEISRPHSTVFIFTEGPAEDYKLLEEVLTAIMEKQSQVIFVVSGVCGETSSKGYEVYDEIAHYSSGLVLKLAKEEVSRALKLVEVMIRKHKVHLGSIDSRQGGTHSYSFVVDQHITKILVSLSDHTVKLDCQSPSKAVSSNRELVVNLPGVKIETLRHPEIGLWNVTVSSLGPYHLRVTAESRIDVKFGFHYKKITRGHVSNLRSRPIKGIANYLYANFTGLTDNNKLYLSFVDVIGVDGRLLASHHINQMYSSNIIVFFSPIRKPFLLRFKGDIDGTNFTRLSSTVIQSSLPDLPTIEMEKKFVVFMGSAVILYCYIESAVTFTVTWKRDGIALDQPTAYEIAVNTSLWLPAKSMAESGLYTCSATNVAGTSEESTTVEIKVHPPSINPLQNRTALTGESFLIECNSFSYTNELMAKTWRKNGMLIVSDDRVIVTQDGHLWIANAKQTDNGVYECAATDSAGKTSRVFHLAVKKYPKVSLLASPSTFQNGDEISLTCKSASQNLPTVQWYKDEKLMKFDGRVVSKRDDEITILSAKERDNGRYKCVANYSLHESEFNEVLSSQTVRVTFTGPPKVHVLPFEQTKMKGAPFSIQCQVKGSPQPNITWTKDGRYLLPSDHVKFLANGILYISQTIEEDSGTYLCAARNKHGEDAGFGTLFIGSSPEIQSSGKTLERSYELGDNAILDCLASGSPSPLLYWLNQNDKEVNNDVTTSHRFENGSLFIKNISVRHTGKYTCRAQNQFGESSLQYLITIRGIEAPHILQLKNDIRYEAVNKVVILPCDVAGRPKPDITWSKENQERPLLSDRHKIFDNGSLAIHRLSPSDGGVYVCKATNYAGSDQVSRRLVVTVPPVIEIHSNEIVTIKQGRSLRLECHASGTPKPIVTWRRDGILLPYIGNSLPLDDVHGSDNGTYECEAVNKGGIAKNSIVVVVNTDDEDSTTSNNEALEAYTQEIPRFDSTPRSVVINTGDTVSFYCNATGNPKPVIKWQRSVVSRSEILEFTADNGLIIRNARIEDSGPYSCSAENDVGTLMTVFQVLVKVDGEFGLWQEWSTCNATCGQGFQERTRPCDSPPPRNGGKGCEGAALQIRSCSSIPCNVDGRYGQWSGWSMCSRTCGSGQHFRIRLCDSPPPSGTGVSCQGESLQPAVCNDVACPGDNVISEVIGSLTGEVNGIKIEKGALMAALTHRNNTVSVSLSTTNIPRVLVKIMRSVTSLLTPIYWAVARQSINRPTGIDIAAGQLRYSGQITYGNLQTLRCEATVRLIPGNQVLMIEAVVNGNAQVFPSTHDVEPLEFQEQFIQVGAGRIYGVSERKLTVGMLPVSYMFNHSLQYSSDSRMSSVLSSYVVDNLLITDNVNDGSLRYDFSAAFQEGSDYCPFGFIKLDGFCEDIDECEQSFCEQLCSNSFGSFTCQCLSGFYLAADGLTCQDIDECSLGVHECDSAQECVDVPGGYECREKLCTVGFELDDLGDKCVDFDECTLVNSCEKDKLCVNTIGSYRCDIKPCNLGYIKEGPNEICRDIDECSFIPDPCRAGESCINTVGSYFCVLMGCDKGYQRSQNGSCVDVDECILADHDCTDEEMCTNVIGSFNCTSLPCLAGFQRNENKTCVDVNECNDNPCGPGEVCQNTEGSFYCEFLICQNGYEYTSDFSACQDVDECTLMDNCPGFYDCINFPGGYRCDGPNCPSGYTEEGNGSCIDINECLIDSICSDYMRCINHNGSYSCECKRGFVMKGNSTCLDIDECSDGTVKCLDNEKCVNTIGGFDCQEVITTSKPTTESVQLITTDSVDNSVEDKTDTLESTDTLTSYFEEHHNIGSEPNEGLNEIGQVFNKGTRPQDTILTRTPSLEIEQAIEGKLITKPKQPTTTSPPPPIETTTQSSVNTDAEIIPIDVTTIADQFSKDHQSTSSSDITTNLSPLTTGSSRDITTTLSPVSTESSRDIATTLSPVSTDSSPDITTNLSPVSTKSSSTTVMLPDTINTDDIQLPPSLIPFTERDTFPTVTLEKQTNSAVETQVNPTPKQLMPTISDEKEALGPDVTKKEVQTVTESKAVTTPSSLISTIAIDNDTLYPVITEEKEEENIVDTELIPTSVPSKPSNAVTSEEEMVTVDSAPITLRRTTITVITEAPLPSTISNSTPFIESTTSTASKPDTVVPSLPNTDIIEEKVTTDEASNPNDPSTSSAPDLENPATTTTLSNAIDTKTKATTNVIISTSRTDLPVTDTVTTAEDVSTLKQITNSPTSKIESYSPTFSTPLATQKPFTTLEPNFDSIATDQPITNDPETQSPVTELFYPEETAADVETNGPTPGLSTKGLTTVLPLTTAEPIEVISTLEMTDQPIIVEEIATTAIPSTNRAVTTVMDVKCKDGYYLNSNGRCEDVNECNAKPGRCGKEKFCLNLKGSFRCVCPRGLMMNPVNEMCSDLNECQLKDFRVCEHLCINTRGSFRCQCRTGYQLASNKRNCVRQPDNNSNNRPNGGISIRKVPHTGTCFNFSGMKLCFCPRGYKWNHKEAVCENLADLLKLQNTVVDDKLKIGGLTRTRKPQPNTAPINNDMISTSAPEPMTGIRMVDGKVPISSPSCPAWFSNRCMHKCHTVGAQYKCTCPEGYTKSTYGACRDVNECWKSKTNCPTKGDHCFNTPGSNRCVSFACPEGYYQFRRGYCEKSCRIGKYGYCRRNYIRYYTLAPKRRTPLKASILTLRVAQFITSRVARVQFYFTKSRSHFTLSKYRDFARLRLARGFIKAGNYDIEINADIFDSKNNLVCRTKFIIYITTGEYNF